MIPWDKLREECGVFGIRTDGLPAAPYAHLGLYALQHRGQESAGIATYDGTDTHLHKAMGLVAQVFSPETPRRADRDRRDRPRAVLDDGRRAPRERAAVSRGDAVGHPRARAQRQPGQRAAPARGARGGRPPVLRDVGHRSHHQADRDRAARHPGGGRRLLHGADPGRVHRRGDGRGPPARVPRRERDPAPRARAARRRRRVRVRDVRVRPHRRRAGARGPTRASCSSRTRAGCARSTCCRRSSARRACSSTSTSRARTPSSSRAASITSGAAWGACWRASIRRRRIS